MSFQKNFELRTSLLELIKFKMFLSKSNAIAFQLRKNVSMLQPRVMVSGAQKYISEDKMIWSIIPTCYLVISTLQLRYSKKIKSFKFFEFFHDFWANSAENALETIVRDRVRFAIFQTKFLKTCHSSWSIRAMIIFFFQTKLEILRSVSQKSLIKENHFSLL